MTRPPNTLFGIHLTSHGMTVVLGDGTPRYLHAGLQPADAVAALTAAGCVGMTGVAAVPAHWPLTNRFALLRQARTAGIILLRVISDLSAAGLAYGVRERTKRFQVMDAATGLGARFLWEDGLCELRQLGRFTVKRNLPGVCFGGDVAGLFRDDDLPAQGALLQAEVLTGTLRNLLLLDGSACSWQVRTGKRWHTLIKLAQSIPTLGCGKLVKGCKQLRFRALGPEGEVWLHRVVPMPCGAKSANILEINLKADHEVTVRVRDKGGKGWEHPLISPLAQDAEEKESWQPWRRGLTLTSEEIDALMVGLEEDDPS